MSQTAQVAIVAISVLAQCKLLMMMTGPDSEDQMPCARAVAKCSAIYSAQIEDDVHNCHELLMPRSSSNDELYQLIDCQYTAQGQ